MHKPLSYQRLELGNQINRPNPTPYMSTIILPTNKAVSTRISHHRPKEIPQNSLFSEPQPQDTKTGEKVYRDTSQTRMDKSGSTTQREESTLPPT